MLRGIAVSDVWIKAIFLKTALETDLDSFDYMQQSIPQAEVGEAVEVSSRNMETVGHLLLNIKYANEISKQVNDS